MGIFIVIPAYNERKTIGKVIGALGAKGYSNIVVVDDGSKDKTCEISKSKGVFVLQHLINRGQGAALKTGIDFALSKGAEIIVTFDADGQHSVEDIKNLILPIQRGEVDVVLGSRFLNKDLDVPFNRKILLKGSVLIQNLFYGIKLTDAHNGLRALSRFAAEKINIESDRMAHASEIIGEIKKRKLTFKEIPVEIIYSVYSLKKGHGSFTQALKVFFKMFIKNLIK